MVAGGRRPPSGIRKARPPPLRGKECRTVLHSAQYVIRPAWPSRGFMRFTHLFSTGGESILDKADCGRRVTGLGSGHRQEKAHFLRTEVQACFKRLQDNGGGRLAAALSEHSHSRSSCCIVERQRAADPRPGTYLGRCRGEHSEGSLRRPHRLRCRRQYHSGAAESWTVSDDGLSTRSRSATSQLSTGAPLRRTISSIFRASRPEGSGRLCLHPLSDQNAEAINTPKEGSDPVRLTIGHDSSTPKHSR